MLEDPPERPGFAGSNRGDGFTPMPGAQRFIRSAEGEPATALGAAARKAAPRDKFIGAPPASLSSSTTQGYCPGSVSNVFHPSARVKRPDDWERRYAPVLLETFSPRPRAPATMQPTRVGKTQGRGKAKNEYALPVKDAETPATALEEGSQSPIIPRVANACRVLMVVSEKSKGRSEEGP